MDQVLTDAGRATGVTATISAPGGGKVRFPEEENLTVEEDQVMHYLFLSERGGLTKYAALIGRWYKAKTSRLSGMTSP